MNRFFPQVRSQLFRAVFAVGAIALLGWGACFAGSVAYRRWHSVKWRGERDAIWNVIDSWEQGDRPPGVNANAWREFCVSFYNVCGNALQYDDTSLEQIRRVRADCEANSREPVTAETFDWLWERLRDHLGPKGLHSLKGIGELFYRESRQWIRPVQPAAP
jgi:hypothetical protein